MNILGFMVLMFVVEQMTTYEQGLEKAESTRSPLMVIVSTAWCGPCKTLKASVEEMRDRELKGVVIVYLDAEERPELAKRLMVGNTVPQISMFHKTSTGVWRRVRSVGLQSKERILEMLKRVTR